MINVRKLEVGDSGDLFAVIDHNRYHLERMSWSRMEDVTTVGKFIVAMGGQHERLFGIFSGEQVVGAVMFRDNLDDRHEISYWLCREHRGQGIMTQAIGSCLLQMSPQQFKTIIAKVMHGNTASRKILHHLGFKRVDQDDMWVHFELTR